MISAQDKKYMQRCLRLAQKGAGYVSPNPLVGCVIVKDNRIISEGWHAVFGHEHAEAVALKNATESVTGATLYCNLEPCFHTNKKTPPCVPLVIDSGIKRVVLANSDPNPLVAGRSIELMREKGIDVVENVLAAEGRVLNRFFFKHITQHKPWITVKIAQTLDGRIALDRSHQTWITGKESQKLVHKLRTQYDAVLVGAGTIRADNPQLNVRFARGRNPAKVIVSKSLDLAENFYIFDNDAAESLWLFQPEGVKNDLTKKPDQLKVNRVMCPLTGAGKIDLSFVTGHLAKNGINSILVEGGQTIFSGFIEQELFDEIIILQAAKIWGKGLKSLEISKEINLEMHECKMLGDDCYINLRKKD